MGLNNLVKTGALVFFALSSMAASADTVRLQLAGLDNGELDAWLTLTGDNIVSGANNYYYADWDTALFEADFGQGLTNFTVTGLPGNGSLSNSSGQYFPTFGEMLLSLSQADIGTQWSFRQGQNPIPGIPNDYYAVLTNIETNESYGQTYINGAYWVQVPLATVPVPAAVWLFGSALAGLGWVKRKHAV